jgi:CBS domain-containing protein
MSTVRALLDRKGTEVLVVPPSMTIARVAWHMREERIGAFVVSNDGRRVEGLVTEREIVYGLARHGASVLDMRAGEIMQRSVITCAPTESIRVAMERMTRLRVRHLPVVDAGVLCGIVSIGDVVKAVVDDVDLESRVLRDAYLARSSS